MNNLDWTVVGTTGALDSEKTKRCFSCRSEIPRLELPCRSEDIETSLSTLSAPASKGIRESYGQQMALQLGDSGTTIESAGFAGFAGFVRQRSSHVASRSMHNH